MGFCVELPTNIYESNNSYSSIKQLISSSQVLLVTKINVFNYNS